MDGRRQERERGYRGTGSGILGRGSWGLRARLVGLGLELGEVLDPHLLDQSHLGLQPVDMLFLALKNVGEQLAADEILDRLAMGDGKLEVWQGHHLQRQVALEDFLRTLPDQKL